jgi:UDP-2,3-diacylglucosamine pyrophosphatase LpxH
MIATDCLTITSIIWERPFKIRSFSDSHFGVSYNPSAVERFCSDCIKDRVTSVILTGDILELLACTLQEILKDPLAMRGVTALKKLAETIPIYLIPGNHDFALIGDYNAQLSLYPIRVIGTDVLLINTTYAFTHGHQAQFDPTAPVTRWLEKVLRPLFPTFARQYFGTPIELKQYNRKEYDRQSMDITGRVANYAASHAWNLIFGHTHRPIEVWVPEKADVLNCGDMISELSYVEVDSSGNCSLHVYEDLK